MPSKFLKALLSWSELDTLVIFSLKSIKGSKVTLCLLQNKLV